MAEQERKAARREQKEQDAEEFVKNYVQRGGE
jgi:hypothetical protein